MAEPRNVAITGIVVALIGAAATITAAMIARSGDEGGGSPATSQVTLPSVPPVGSPAPASVFTNRTSGPGGSEVSVSGEGFQPGERVVLSFHTEQIGDTRANSEGRFQNVEVTIPTSFSLFAPRQFSIRANGESSIKSATTPFTISG